MVNNNLTLDRPIQGASLMAQPGDTGDTEDAGSIPGLGRSPGEGNGNSLPSILAWKIPWTDKPDRLQSIGSQRVGHD